ncbi:tail fiber assembly protein [Candidatus Symbiopectobacterium sp. NZEC127]|uniref:tail fiber assembly protein n=1 Tax=Candidatus Symbiopectobacterium sp. NZEC127 TaxID=2820472 RepID=UPI002227D526|nr:tail fiber assembly protein [Candidatus Symbiopectobacterium sp. NZEC127]MCW2484759.1 tail fiber assembly protein [Candidatus Symbiopectobacterium sp. NZEC127]
MSNYSTTIETAELGENGLSKKAGWITVYHVNQDTGEYQSASMEYLMFGVGLPAYSYPDEPELPAAGQALRRAANGKSWEFVPDHRGQMVYSIETREPSLITTIGELMEGFTLLEPATEFDGWNGKRWVTDAKAQQAAELQAAQQAAQQALTSRLTVANARIQTLSDAVDLDMATDEEKAALTKWKTYRVILNRIDVSATPDIDWPKAPE